MRAKTVSHVEYEILQYVLDNIDITEVEDKMCPVGDEVAKKRFERGAKSVSQLVGNLVKRRLHKLPKTHREYKEKVE
jgi:hypothetical protein|tara:strand:+ start:1200 stop:1430 length:231 start_codon:yes stop_codon:yes gene_type:complete